MKEVIISILLMIVAFSLLFLVHDNLHYPGINDVITIDILKRNNNEL